ncbi:MAG: L,D-transpeptidase/peptidoglycan binding protein [Lachnospiraceae bacterium]|nr:L,D-transpeptidase/peptidoglycan binding protein [Lachnospiraceae bacterium]
MKKVIITIVSIVILLPLLAAGIGYGYLSYRYRDVFMPGLNVNNVYTAEQTIDQVNKKLKENLTIPEVTVTDRSGETFTFSMEEADYDENYTDDLKKIKARQTVIALVRRIVDENSKVDTQQIEPKITYDEDKLKAFLDEQDFLADNTDLTNKQIKIEYDKNKGYYLRDDTTDLLSHEAACEAILKAVENEAYETDLDREDCYITPESYTPSQNYALNTWKKLKPYMDTKIVYNYGNRKVTLNAAKISDWIVVDDNGIFKTNEFGDIKLDEEAIEEYVKDLCDTYSSVNKPRTFKSHRGTYITIHKGTYGSKIDYKPELEYLLSQLPRGREVEHTPEYSQLPFSGLGGTEDIGDTYIEVDMSEQHLYYWVNGRLKLDSDVVTGNTSLKRGTPERVCYVYYKQRGRTLRGEDYATYVNYWMAVYNNIGIHDANWRGKFGGTIYRTAGSHGCVNTPIAKVKELYDMVEIGTPVLLYY